MNWQLLRNHLVNQHTMQPQQIMMIDHALNAVRQGLEQLAQMGHMMHLADGAAPPTAEWPRLVFSVDRPNGFMCLCEQDFALLGPGWFNTLAEAQHADGMGEQFKRGGIFPKKGLPLVVDTVGRSRLDQLGDHGEK